jgi:Fe-S-cluster-containing dehydrogenase component
MKKCTLCIDRIYNENFVAEERVPACVKACPTGARAFGDLGNPDSAVSKNVAARGGYDLMPELGYKPTNKYLPPRDKRAGDSTRPPVAASSSDTHSAAVESLFAWIDRALSRAGHN